jgi:hypothetical protein
VRSQSQRARKPSSRRHHPARRAAVTAHSRQPLILYFSRRQRRRFEGARARKLSHNARPSPALSTPETPHGGSLRLSLEPIFGSLSRKGLQAEGPSRDGASAPTLTLCERESHAGGGAPRRLASRGAGAGEGTRGAARRPSAARPDAQGALRDPRGTVPLLLTCTAPTSNPPHADLCCAPPPVMHHFTITLFAVLSQPHAL